MSTSVKVARLPTCDFCPETAKFDAKTKMGPWAYLCPRHFRELTHGGLGTGRGQELVLEAASQ